MFKGSHTRNAFEGSFSFTMRGWRRDGIFSYLGLPYITWHNRDGTIEAQDGVIASGLSNWRALPRVSKIKAVSSINRVFLRQGNSLDEDMCRVRPRYTQQLKSSGHVLWMSTSTRQVRTQSGDKRYCGPIKRRCFCFASVQILQRSLFNSILSSFSRIVGPRALHIAPCVIEFKRDVECTNPHHTKTFGCEIYPDNEQEAKIPRLLCYAFAFVFPPPRC